MQGDIEIYVNIIIKYFLCGTQYFNMIQLILAAS